MLKVVAVWKRKPKVPVVIGGIYKRESQEGDRFYLMTSWRIGTQVWYGLMGFDTGTPYGGRPWGLDDMRNVVEDSFELIYDPMDQRGLIQMTLEYVKQGGQDD